MFREVIDGFKRWMTCDDVYSALALTSKTCDRLWAEIESLGSRVRELEAAEKSRTEAIDLVTLNAESIKPVCDDCISMRLEIDALKLRLEALEIAGKSSGGWGGGQTNNTQAVPASDSKPKRGRRKSDVKESVA